MAFLGKTLVSKSGIINISALDFKNPLLIYFSASWCPPCRMFTPTLAEFYNKLNTPAKQVEVIFATLDENKKEYKYIHMAINEIKEMSNEYCEYLLKTYKPEVEIETETKKVS